MPNNKWKRPNALKHGIYASPAVIAGEDPREFEEVHAALIEEWMPDGALEEEAVFSIAKAIWSKRRGQQFLEVQLLTNALDVKHPSFDEALGLRGLAAVMEQQPETAFDEYANRSLRPDKVKHLQKKFPRLNFKSSSEWAKAVVNEINSVLLPAITFSVREPPEEWHKVPDELRRRMDNMLSIRRAIASDPLFEKELALDERLDARIDRLFKRLMHIKSMKQILRQTCTEREDNQPLKLVAKRTTK